ncbi:isoaspartyl peptidase/L-asparaginase [Natronobeatus ordinarius]|uniref:isoaspartyl peptidase/L-asparaginase n=1 Tax=Natronobeatus ordinarius TaxID=2963433 RepID=UPI0020CCE672|nr:isoaspartyl peptidase/L-asparaginase family protein [Natronobeatus ordinarius]
MHVIVHGGAGGEPEEPDARQAVLEESAEAGVDAETPLSAVEAAVRVLESSPRFNAGVGGAVQSDGVVRTDAGIMTDDRRVGAVCSMPGVEHAVSVARVVLEETPHTFVAGEHAVSLAEDYGVETEVDLWTERTRERWAELEAPEGGSRAQLEWIQARFGQRDQFGEETPGIDDEHDHDTVGAVAFDGERLAAATSTGGRWLALAGRVGDVPQIGSGYYCSPAGGASATGAGEDIARVTLSRRVVRHLERGLDAQGATELAIEEFGELTGSSAGVIAIDASGSLGSAYNSDAMQTARARR